MTQYERLQLDWLAVSKYGMDSEDVDAALRVAALDEVTVSLDEAKRAVTRYAVEGGLTIGPILGA